MGALTGKVAVVVGGSRGIGKGIAVELAAAGATVYAAGRSLDAPVGEGHMSSLADTVADAAALGGTVVPVRCDAMDDAAVASLFEKVTSEQGRVDVLVNSVFNASEFGATIGKKFWELPLSIWRDVVDLGTRTAYVASYYAAPLLLAAGKGAVIVNVSARGAQIYRYNVAYGTGKAALDKMTRDMAKDLSDQGIAVVSLWPNVTLTEALARRSAEAETDPWESLGGTASLETPRYSGRAVVSLVTDPDVMARTGGSFWSAELGTDYGLVDENGMPHASPDLATSGPGFPKP